MKKIYLLSLLCCIKVAAFAQISAAPVYAIGAAGSFTTGTGAVTPTRADGNIVATGLFPTRRGYARFDIGSLAIPTGSTITNVTVGYYIQSFTGAIVACNTNVYPGDLRAVTVPATLYADMGAPPSANVSSVTYPTGTGIRTIASTPAALAAVQASMAGILSYVWTNTGTGVYTITGETGSASTIAALHAPYIQIDYCPPPTGVTASASPTSLCSGSTLTLSGSGSVTGGIISYVWDGPAGYTAAGASPSFATTTSSAGVYTLTAINTCGAFTATTTATTASVVVNTAPNPIGGPAAVCTGSAVALSESTPGGTWSSSSTGIATVDISGNTFGVSFGTSTISYTDGNGCYATSTMSVNDAPGPVSGPANVCEGSIITLTDGVAGGAWSSSATGIATADPVTGDITGVFSGSAFINYIIAGCPPASYSITVDPIPSPISGTTTICEGYTSTLGDADGGGTWTSSVGSIASVSGTGIMYGAGTGIATITYTLGSGCYNTVAVTVNAVPAAFTGPTEVCAGSTITLVETTGAGTWGTGAGGIATVNSTGDVGGVSNGAAYITYTLSTGCYYTSPITVYALPPIPTGVNVVCQGAVTNLTDGDPGGTWASANTLFATVGTSSGIVTGVNTGVVNITYTALTGCVNFVPVTVNGAPVAVVTPAGPTTFCVGGNVLLNASVGGGYTYQWYAGGAAIPGATLSSYTSSATGLFTVLVTNPIGCSSTSSVTPVSSGINAVINSSGRDTFCIGDHVILTANSGGAIGALTYQWQRNNVNIPAATAGSYYATDAGVYTSIVSVSGGSGTCVVTTTPATVMVNPLPAPVISFSGSSFSTPNTFSNYQWYVNFVGIPGATSYTYVPHANGNYQVVVYDGNNCKGYSSSYMLTTVGVQNVGAAQAISIYPNPATSVVHIEANENVHAVVTGIEGKVLIDVRDTKEVNINDLAHGLYMLTLYDAKGERLMVQKLVKE